MRDEGSGPKRDSPAAADGRPRRWRRLLDGAGRVRPWVQYAATAVIAGLILWRTDLGATWEVLRTVEPAWAIGGVAALIVSNQLHSLKWQKLLSGLGRVPLGEASAVFWASMATNSVFPLRAGDVLRVDLLARRNRLPRSGVVGTLLTERVLDALCFLAILLAAFTALSSSASEFYLVGLLLAGIAVVSLGLTVALTRLNPDIPLSERAVLRWLPRPLQRVADAFLPGFVQGLQPLGRLGSGSEVFAWALGAWAFESAAFALFGRAFGLDVDLGTYLLVMVAVNFVGSLTILPANLGVFEIAAIGVLQAGGASTGEATGYAVGSHLLVFATIGLIGLASLGYLRIRLRDLGRLEGAASRGRPGDTVQDESGQRPQRPRLQ